MTISPEGRLVRARPVKEGVLVHLIGCEMLHEEAIPVIQDELEQLADGYGPAQYLLDLSSVRFLTSTGLGMLVGFHTKVQDNGGKLTLCGASNAIRELFEVTKLTRVLTFRDEVPAL